jgi:hypothetical protein
MFELPGADFPFVLKAARNGPLTPPTGRMPSAPRWRSKAGTRAGPPARDVLDVIEIPEQPTSLQGVEVNPW